ncbi:DUF1876 domain-containing protein [Prauserella sp. PE36]|uniref:DUF1876 domain-containing protein n=1 Tax=Prauserella endophytica TaxID=1592324 RepID=A0ABY2SB14_9PSEU|nr:MULTISPECIES: DUF1876 domain-containing protein [Prauserella]PXY29186.1 hypothetical protein BAY59_16365 [Prauserella coralliicola]RBM21536.1 DUF1876 domain-containing protein [Prauserella sp. PE36]TKG72876.1 DUF1876 domain-containing protein [Prauserella endophytica]
MEHETRWTVDIDIHEYEDRTRAEARLNTGAGTERTGTGTARKHPRDANVPAIGDELAVARAMADLSHQLIEATAADIEAVTRRPAHLTE